MKKQLMTGLFTVLALTAGAQTFQEWRNPEINAVNRAPMHTNYFAFENADAAKKADKKQSTNYMTLNGTWKFNWVKDADSRPTDFWKTGFNDKGWDDLQVPAVWELNGYGDPIYVNVGYAWRNQFQNNPPEVPTENNHVGSYRKEIILPASWKGKDIIAHFGSVTSNMYLWVNGRYVGYSEDSKLEAEFDLTPYLKPGQKNLIAFQVFRWCDGSYLEDQDFFRYSGVGRDCYLYARNKKRIQDIRVTPDLDAAYQNGSLAVNLDLKGSGKVDLELVDAQGKQVATATANKSGLVTMNVENPKKWSAETPYLYTLRASMQGSNEVIPVKVGFRKIELKGDQILVNGKAVLFKGADRHEMDPDGGYVVSPERMLQDIQIMKQFNLNAVRTCHYPDDNLWYDLCDQYGIYVVAEANIESHGMGYGPASLAKDSTWLTAHMDRTHRMYERSKNHPAIVIWSLGNEAGNGINFERTYDWMKSVEKSRPVQYERAEQNYNTDIYCRMYRSVEELMAYARQTEPKVYRPFIMTEYLHTMGNSGGGLKEYMHVFETEPIVQGGCIWDWVDQSFREIDKDGKWYWSYGGDYGPKDVPSFGNFCCNGLVNAVREPHPHLIEVKKEYQYIKSALTDPKKLTVEVKNWYDFTNLNAYTLHWQVMGDDGKVIAEGTRKADCAPHEAVTFSLGAVKLPSTIREAYLNLSWTPDKATPFIGTHDEVAYDQFVLSANKGYRAPEIKLADKVKIDIDPATGALRSYIYKGKEMLSSPVVLSLYRPVTDNDSREKTGGAKVWRKEGLDNMIQKATFVKASETGGKAEVELWNAKGVKLGMATFVYTLQSNGVLKVKTTFLPDTSAVTSLARVGLAFEMPYAYNKVSYLGRGEHETYIDRNQSGCIGIYHTDAERMFHYYVKPQATGNRTDVRWMELADEAGEGLSFRSDKVFQFSVIPFTDSNVDKATHINKLERTGIINVHLDAEQSGVGTATCGPGVLPPYRVPVEKHTFEFMICPLK